MNANDATLTELATAQSGSMVPDNAPNAPAGANFNLVLEAVAGSATGQFRRALHPDHQRD